MSITSLTIAGHKVMTLCSWLDRQKNKTPIKVDWRNKHNDLFVIVNKSHRYAKLSKSIENVLLWQSQPHKSTEFVE